MAVTATIIESPEGDRLVLSAQQWGTADVTERAWAGLGNADLWQVHSQRRLAADIAPADFLIADFHGIYADWNLVAEVDDTNCYHVRLYPEKMGQTALQYFGLAKTLNDRYGNEWARSDRVCFSCIAVDWRTTINGNGCSIQLRDDRMWHAGIRCNVLGIVGSFEQAAFLCHEAAHSRIQY